MGRHSLSWTSVSGSGGRISRPAEWLAVLVLAGPFESTAVPSHLDWERDQGQTPERAFCPQRTHKNFRWWWYEYAGGMVTGWGNHHVDIAQWGMDCDLTGPVSVDGLFPNAKGPQFYKTPDRFFARMR